MRNYLEFVSLKENRVYLIIAFFIVLVIILAFIFSGSDYNAAVVPFDIRDEWYEDINERRSDSQFFGLEGSSSFTYRNNNDTYPSYITVTTMKTFFMMNEKELKDMTKTTIIEKASGQNMTIDEKSLISGERVLKNGHRTMYVIYNGSYNSSWDKLEQIRFIGETWNCDKSGTSIICIGYAQVTNKTFNNSELNLEFWAKIVGDKEGTFMDIYSGGAFYEDFLDEAGLIYNIKCH